MKLLLLNNKIDFDKIKLQYNDRYNFYNIQYDLSYILIKGIPLHIKYHHKIINNTVVYVYISDPLYLNLLRRIDSHFKDKCRPCLKKYNQQYYIICNNYKNIEFDDENNIYINIVKIKNIYNSFVPIINII